MRLLEAVFRIMKKPVCNNCLGRLVSAQLLTGWGNKERGMVLRSFVAFLLDSGEKLNLELSNFHNFKFVNFKGEIGKRKKCYLCGDFFEKELTKYAQRIVEKMGKYEFETFLIGCKPTAEMVTREEEAFEEIGIEFVERIKDEITRELGKIVSKRMRKKFDARDPELIAIVDLRDQRISLQVKSLFVYAKYKKFAKIPQLKSVCPYCRGKGCVKCEGRGKLHPTSVQEIIEKPFKKFTQCKKTKFHAAGREEVDTRCLDFRPFVLELVKPVKRKIPLKKIKDEVNKSKKVQISTPRFATKELVRSIKAKRFKITYIASITFSKKLNKEKLKEFKKYKSFITQEKRRKKIKRRKIESLKFDVISDRKLSIKIKVQAGTNIAGFIKGDKKVEPNLPSILENKVRKFSLDILKIHFNF